MSLVNDALKRATEVQKTRPPTPMVNLPLRPVEPVKPRKAGFGLVLPATLATIIAAALFSLSISNHSSHSTPVPASPVQTPTSGVPVISAIMDLAPAPLVVAAKEIPPTPPPVPPAPVVVAAPPPPAPLRLQAVFYSPPNPSAIISGKTVHVGDTLRELQVVAIGSSSALLISTTETNFLTLE